MDAFTLNISVQSAFYYKAENIHKHTLDNTDYRRVHQTNTYSQLVFMCLKPGEYIDWETHDNTDQFIRVESGTAEIIV
jgi:mannose-6-phosphate isomerase-like protein (cupin superfamily)